MRQALTFDKAARSIIATKFRVLRLAALSMALAGCSTLTGGPDSGREITASAGDVNWAFADVSAMEQKVASLQSENARLSKRVMELEGALDAVSGASTAASTASAPPLKETPVAAASPSPATTAAQPATVISPPDQPVASAPVAEAPRLVQPTFAAAEAVYENEAPTGDGGLAVSSVLWGVHLASYRAQDEARNGWRQLQRENPDELGLLEPRVEQVAIEGRGRFWRLIGGGFASEDKARALCQTLEQKGLYCQVAGFGGERLSLAPTG